MSSLFLVPIGFNIWLTVQMQPVYRVIADYIEIHFPYVRCQTDETPQKKESMKSEDGAY
jgi:hypothetical protein